MWQMLDKFIFKKQIKIKLTVLGLRLDFWNWFPNCSAAEILYLLESRPIERSNVERGQQTFLCFTVDRSKM